MNSTAKQKRALFFLLLPQRFKYRTEQGFTYQVGFLEQDEKKTIANSMFTVGRAVRRDVDPARLSSMPDAEFEKEVGQLSNEILLEIEELKKRYYEEGFREALKQVKQGQEEPVMPSVPAGVVVSTPQPSQPTAVVSFDTSQFDSKFSDIDQKLFEFSDRIAAIEQTVLSSSSHDEELKQIIGENRDLVSTLKNRLSEIAVIQSSIEEKVSQAVQPQPPSTELQEQIESLNSQIGNLGDSVASEGSKFNKLERARKASVRRLERNLNAIEKKLEDFKKVRREIRRQGKRITKLSEGVVEKTSFRTALKRVSASKTKASKHKRTASKRKNTVKPRARAAATTVSPKQLVIMPGSIKIVGPSRKAAGRPRRKTKAKARTPKHAAKPVSKISISAPASTSVEINQKKVKR